VSLLHDILHGIVEHLNTPDEHAKDEIHAKIDQDAALAEPAAEHADPQPVDEHTDPAGAGESTPDPTLTQTAAAANGTTGGAQ